MHDKKRTLLVGLFAFLILHAGTHLSLLTRTDLAVSDFFLPTAFGLVLVYWLGPKIIVPVVYINGIVSSYFWGNTLDNWPYYFLYALPETFFVFLTWWLYIKFLKGKCWFPDTRNTVLFIVTGVFIPSLISSILLQALLYITNELSPDVFWQYVASNLLAEIFNTFFFTMPVLYFATPWLKKKGFLSKIKESIHPPHIPSRSVVLEMLAIFLCLFGLVFLVEFKEFWFIYGVFSLYVALRFGFGPTIITNQYILIIIYIIPRFYGSFGKNVAHDYLDVMNIFLGACLLFIFAVITGRVINDLRSTDKKLKRQYSELEKTNQELNQFVYRVSHDLSAPLKSIRGLVNLGKLSATTDEYPELFSRIEISISRLEEFILEIMDYFNNKRFKINHGKINIKALCKDIIDNMHRLPGEQTTNVYYDLKEEEIFQDKVRLKIILKNIIYNAVKYQKKTPEHEPFVKITSEKEGEDIQIKIQDNGIGIKQDRLDQIFTMFYRGNPHSAGSGLGLYIAKEVTAKLNGSIKVNSTFGEGTTFIISLKDQQPSKVVRRGKVSLT